MTTFIYVLKCPITNKIKYVGKANNPKKRYYGHINNNKNIKNIHKKNWINSLLNKNLKPVLEVVKEVLLEDWKYWEGYYINYYYNKGEKLTNQTEGGDGLTFGNQTSFKKGHKAWNKGTRQNKKCLVCNNVFGVSPSSYNKYKCCSMECGSKYKKYNYNKGKFKKGKIPWNKGIKGYSSNRKNYVVSEDTKKRISSSLKGRINNGNSKVVYQIDRIRNLVVNKFLSASEAQRQTSISASSITNNINGYSASAGGYKWIKGE